MWHGLGGATWKVKGLPLSVLGPLSRLGWRVDDLLAGVPAPRTPAMFPKAGLATRRGRAGPYNSRMASGRPLAGGQATGRE
jgi:hypothetical protein